jgi:peptidyl-prolyl cis-trans isomerase SurA
VNDDVILASELAEMLEPEIGKLRQRHGKQTQRLEIEIEQLKKKMLRELIDHKLLEQEAKKSGIEVDNLSVEDAIRTIMADNEIPSREIFQSELAKMGLTLDEYKESLRTQLRVMRFRNREFRKYVSVLDNEIKNYYEENRELFMIPGEATVKWFQLPLDHKDPQGSRDRARTLRENALQKGNWDELVAKHSVGPRRNNGGLIGKVDQGQINEVFEEVIFALREPGITRVVEHDGVLHFFNVVSLEEPTYRPLAEVRERIERVVVERKIEERTRVWLDHVFEKSYIYIYRERIFAQP